MTDLARGGGAPRSPCDLDALARKLLSLRAEIDAALAELANHTALHSAAPAEDGSATHGTELESRPEAAPALPDPDPDQRKSADDETAPAPALADPTPSVWEPASQQAVPAENSEPELIGGTGGTVDSPASPPASAQHAASDQPALEKAEQAGPAQIELIALETGRASEKAEVVRLEPKKSLQHRPRYRAAMVPACLAASLAGAFIVLADSGDLSRLRERAGAAGSLFGLLEEANWPFDLAGQAARVGQSFEAGEPAPILPTYDRFKRLTSRQSKVSTPVAPAVE